MLISQLFFFRIRGNIKKLHQNLARFHKTKAMELFKTKSEKKYCEIDMQRLVT